MVASRNIFSLSVAKKQYIVPIFSQSYLGVSQGAAIFYFVKSYLLIFNPYQKVFELLII